jgi:hypothetical protein
VPDAAPMTSSQREEGASTPLHAKIEQMLTEARVVLPGAQALFGFQLAIVLTQSFEQLPSASRIVHAASPFVGRPRRRAAHAWARVERKMTKICS